MISEKDLSACTFAVDVLTIGSMSPLVKNGAAAVLLRKKKTGDRLDPR
jgi:hypothetical protein